MKRVYCCDNEAPTIVYLRMDRTLGPFGTYQPTWVFCTTFILKSNEVIKDASSEVYKYSELLQDIEKGLWKEVKDEKILKLFEMLEL